MGTKPKAVVLSSGGLDSATVMAIARKRGFDIFSLSLFYGQRHSCELLAAKKVAETSGAVRHMVVDVDLRKIGGSALTSRKDVPKRKDEKEREAGIPTTYVPARNTIFLSVALAWLEVLEAWDIFMGVNSIDYSGYPDCRPEYIEAYEKMANLATKAGVEHNRGVVIHTPLIKMTKAQIITKGIELGVDYGITHSCYDPPSDGSACGYCDSCLIRKKGFLIAGVADPTKYIKQHEG